VSGTHVTTSATSGDGQDGAPEQTTAAPAVPSPAGPQPGDAPDGPAAGGPAPEAARASALRQPATLVIIGMTLLALAVRLYYFTRPGYLLGVTEYDDGSYFGSAVRLVHGVLPYRDFVFVQPPGITILMTPVALLSKVTGTDTGLAVARILTMLAGAAGTALAGLLVRHRGALAALIATGVVAVYADSVASSHTLLVEPWVVLFCLIGAVAVFDGDTFTSSRRRLVWGGVAFGFAGLIEAWAIVPVLVLLVLMIRNVRRTLIWLAGVAAGFLLPVAPFAALAPRSFFHDVITAQIGGREGAIRVPLYFRIRHMAGFANYPDLRHTLVLAVAAALAVFVVVATLVASGLARKLPPVLDWFAYGTTAAIIAMFLWPSQFHYHFSGFLAPFFGLSLALPAARLVAVLRDKTARAPVAGRAIAALAGTVAAVVLAAGTVSQVSFEHTLLPLAPIDAMAIGKKIIPPGACVLADNVAYTITANRFVNSRAGCPTVDDGTGANFALSHGLAAETGAGRVPAVYTLWREALTHADYLWFTSLYNHRIAWNPALRTYVDTHFVRVRSDVAKFRLYVRKGFPGSNAG
jgi:alpha-1,2-mannosyltransferase